MVRTALHSDLGSASDEPTCINNLLRKSDGYNAAWEILEKRENGDGETIGLSIELVRASTLDNPYAADKARFERQYAKTGRETQALHGGFAAAQGLVYSGFSRGEHVVAHSETADRLEGETESWRIYRYDSGWNDPRVLLELGKTSYDQLIVLDEFHKSETHVESSIAWLEGRPAGTIYAEHEPAEIQKFQRAGHSTRKAEKSIGAGISEVRRRLELDGDGRPGLLISDQCDNLLRELVGYKEESVGTSSTVDHCLDSLRYTIMGDSAGPIRTTRRGSGPRQNTGVQTRSR